MRVTIGKYPDRWISNVHTNHMEKKYGFGYRENITRTDEALEVIEGVLQHVYNWTGNLVIDRLKQRSNVHIDPWDTWSMDHTLAPIILPMLKQLKETQHGAPDVEMKDVPKEFRENRKEITDASATGETSALHFERWNWIMDQMIFAFQSKVDDRWEEQFESGMHDWDETRSEMVKGPNDTFKIDFVGHKAYQERITNGFYLFGKYYENLWD